MTWIDIFREVAEMCRKEALSLWGTERAREVVGRGAGGDTTIFMDSILEKTAISALKKVNNIRIISEEMGTVDFGEPKKIVIMDPLDGSLNAKSGIPVFSISLACADFPGNMGDVNAGFVYDFISGNEYYALKGEGAWLNGRRLKTQNSDEILLVSTEYYPRTAWTVSRLKGIYDMGMRMRTLGSIALDLCYLAQGIFSSVIEMRAGMCRALDISAGVLIVKEAGGIVSDALGRSIEKMKIDFESRRNIVASANMNIHRKILRRLKRRAWCVLVRERDGKIGARIKKIANEKDIQCAHFVNPHKREIEIIEEFLKMGNNAVISSKRNIQLNFAHVYELDEKKGETLEEYMRKWDIP